MTGILVTLLGSAVGFFLTALALIGLPTPLNLLIALIVAVVFLRLIYLHIEEDVRGE